MQPVLHLPDEVISRYGLWDMVPNWGRDAVFHVRSKEDVDDIGQLFGGRASKPRQPIIIYGPNDQPLTLVVGAGVTETAELEDHVYEQIEAGPVSSEYIAEYREQHGYGRIEDFETNVKEAISERVKKHLQNPRTDPAPNWLNFKKRFF